MKKIFVLLALACFLTVGCAKDSGTGDSGETPASGSSDPADDGAADGAADGADGEADGAADGADS